MGTFWLNLWLTDWVDYCYHHHHLLLIPGFLSPLERRKLTAKQKVWKQKCNNLINPLLHNSTLQSMHPLPFSFWEKKERVKETGLKSFWVYLSLSLACTFAFIFWIFQGREGISHLHHPMVLSSSSFFFSWEEKQLLKKEIPPATT